MAGASSSASAIGVCVPAPPFVGLPPPPGASATDASVLDSTSGVNAAGMLAGSKVTSGLGHDIVGHGTRGELSAASVFGWRLKRSITDNVCPRGPPLPADTLPLVPNAADTTDCMCGTRRPRRPRIAAPAPPPSGSNAADGPDTETQRPRSVFLATGTAASDSTFSNSASASLSDEVYVWNAST